MSTVTTAETPSVKGATITLGTTALAFRFSEIQLPPAAASMIDVTDVGVTRYSVALFEELVRIGEMNCKAYLDSALLDTAQTTAIAQNQTITTQLPKIGAASAGPKWVHWGALLSCTPNNMVLEDGSGVGVDLVFGISNLNAALEETGPAYTAATT